MNVLLIFVKNPVAGKVKTRLAASVGDEKALEIYRHLLAITKNAAAGTGASLQVWYSDKVEQEDLWEDGKFSKFRQAGDNLGARMRNAFNRAFEEGADKVVIIGSDCPGLTTEHLQDAYRILDERDVVIGPSADGGYYLLGMNRCLPALFAGIEWSTPEVLGQTKRILNENSISYSELELLNDIDTAEDLENDTILPARL